MPRKDSGQRIGTGSDDRRLVLLLATRSGAGVVETAAALSILAPQLHQRAEASGLELRVGCQLPDDPLALAAKGMGRTMTPVSALLQVTGPPQTPDDALVEVVESVAADLRDTFDLAISAAALGAVRRITTGPTGPVVLAVGTRKLATLSEEQFCTYWAETHAPLALSMMPAGAARKIGYEQLHAGGAASRRAAAAAGVGVGDLAGVLQVFCRDPVDFLAFAAEPGFAARIYADEKNFADQSLMRGGFIRLDD